MNTTETLMNQVHEGVVSGDLDNQNLAQLLELIGGYLNLKTIPVYAKENNLSYNGVKYHRKIVKIFNVKFVVDND